MLSKRTIILAIVTVLAGLVQSAFAVKVDDKFTIYAVPNGEDTQGGKKVLADGGYYEFTVKVADAYKNDWELVEESITWSGPTGFAGPKGCSLAIWCSPNNGQSYTISATGRLRRNPPVEGLGDPVSFDAKSAGAIDKPIMFWSAPTQDKVVSVGTASQTTIRVEYYAKTSGEAFEYSGHDDLIAISYRLKALEGEVAGSKVNFGDPDDLTLTGGPVPSGSKSDQAIIHTTPQARGAIYCSKADLFFTKTGARLFPRPNNGEGATIEDSKRIYVVQCRFIAFARKPGLGHGWWKLTLSPSSATVLLTSAQIRWLNKETGYYSLHHTPTGPGAVEIGPQGAADGMHFWNISLTQLKNALNYAAALDASPGHYSVTSHNCVVEVRATASAAGVTSIPAFIDPDSLSDWLNQQ